MWYLIYIYIHTLACTVVPVVKLYEFVKISTIRTFIFHSLHAAHAHDMYVVPRTTTSVCTNTHARHTIPFDLASGKFQ